ncbi:oligogalacturonate lyase, partial [Gilliamella apicola]
MAKGNIVRLSYSSFTDEDSKNEIIRLTPEGILCHRNY